MYRWFSDVMNRDQGFLAYRPRMSSNSGERSMSYFCQGKKSVSEAEGGGGQAWEGREGGDAHLEVRVQLVRAEDLGDLHELIVVVVSMEERFFPENLRSRKVSGVCVMTRREKGGLTMLANMHPSDHMSSE